MVDDCRASVNKLYNIQVGYLLQASLLAFRCMIIWKGIFHKYFTHLHEPPPLQRFLRFQLPYVPPSSPHPFLPSHPPHPYLPPSTAAMTSHILQLATRILANAETVTHHLQSHHLPQPTFAIDGPPEMELDSKPAEAARISAIESAMELQDLLLGPKMLLRPVVSLPRP